MSMWRGVPQTKLYFLNEWADAEIAYRGKVYSATEIENTLFDITGVDEDVFDAWIADNLETVYEVLDASEPCDYDTDYGKEKRYVHINFNMYGDPLVKGTAL